MPEPSRRNHPGGCRPSGLAFVTRAKFSDEPLFEARQGGCSEPGIEQQVDAVAVALDPFADIARIGSRPAGPFAIGDDLASKRAHRTSRRIVMAAEAGVTVRSGLAVLEHLPGRAE